MRLDKYNGVISSNRVKKIKGGQKEVLLCNYMDVCENTTIDSSTPFIQSIASGREIVKYTFRQDDVVITKDSEIADDIASAAVVKELRTRVLCGYHWAILRPPKGKVK